MTDINILFELLAKADGHVSGFDTSFELLNKNIFTLALCSCAKDSLPYLNSVKDIFQLRVNHSSNFLRNKNI